jgi:hypothetical protein
LTLAECALSKQSGQSSEDEYRKRATELRDRASLSADVEYRILLIEAAQFYERMAEGMILPAGGRCR